MNEIIDDANNEIDAKMKQINEIKDAELNKIAELDERINRLTEIMNVSVEGSVTHILNLVYPVGSIYTSFKNTEPGILFGGVWEPIVDRFLYCAHSSGEVGGSSKITIANLPAHNHGSSGLTTNSTGAHTHRLWGYGNTLGSGSTGWRFGANGYSWASGITESSGAHSHTISGNTASTGNGSDYMPPYITVFEWKRIE
jgi:hypothetical protein